MYARVFVATVASAGIVCTLVSERNQCMKTEIDKLGISVATAGAASQSASAMEVDSGAGAATATAEQSTTTTATAAAGRQPDVSEAGRGNDRSAAHQHGPFHCYAAEDSCTPGRASMHTLKQTALAQQMEKFVCFCSAIRAQIGLCCFFICFIAARVHRTETGQYARKYDDVQRQLQELQERVVAAGSERHITLRDLIFSSSANRRADTRVLMRSYLKCDSLLRFNVMFEIQSIIRSGVNALAREQGLPASIWSRRLAAPAARVLCPRPFRAVYLNAYSNSEIGR